MLAEQEHSLTNDRPQVRASQIARRGLLARAGGAALLLPALLLVFSVPFVSPTDADYWWHVRTGQLIRATGAVPHADVYSFTAAGHPWVAQEWLTEVALAAVAGWFGYVGNAVLFGLLGAAALACVALACRRRGVDWLTTAFCTFWAGVMCLPSLGVRPQLTTLALAALTAFLLTGYEQGQRRALWVLPPLFALWANLHAGYLIGLALLALATAGAALTWLARRQAPTPFPLLVATALSGLATLLTPHGLDVLRYPLSYGRENASLQFIAEWQSPNFHSPLFWPFAASLLLAVVLGVGRRSVGATAALWTVLFAFLGLQSIRHIPLYAVVVTPVLAARLREGLRALPALPLRWRGPARAGAALLAVLLPLLLLGGQALAVGAGQWQFGREPSAAGYPAGAVAYMEAHQLAGPIFNEYRWGGYLIARLWPQERVFIDGRADPYGDALLARYRDAVQAHPGWRQTLDDYQIHLALLDVNSPLAAALAADPAWQQVYGDDTARLFQRRSPAGQSTP
ncbi:MAG: hypothetical protein ACTHMA_15685 [Thermomicrobiales bacterium]